MSNTVILAVDPSDLQTVDALTLAGPLTALVAVCLVLAVLLVITVIVMSRPRRNSAKATQPRGAHNEAGPKATWHARINDVLSRYESGTLNREARLWSWLLSPVISQVLPAANDWRPAHSPI